MHYYETMKSFIKQGKICGGKRIYLIESNSNNIKMELI